MQPEPAGGGFSHVETLCGLGEGTQFPRVPSFTPISRATSAIGRDVSITSFTASSLNSGVNFRRLSGTDDHLHSGPDLIGSGVRNVGGTPRSSSRDLRALSRPAARLLTDRLLTSGSVPVAVVGARPRRR